MTVSERRYLERRVSLRAEGDDAQPVIDGYAALFYDGTAATEYVLWPGTVERIMPGAFDRAVREDDVRALFNHDSNFVLGRRRPGDDEPTLSLSIDNVGLRYEIRPPAARADVVEAIRRGDVSGSSFAFLAESNWREIENEDHSVLTVREITAVTLFDVGPVTYPAYESTSAAIRSSDRAALQREIDAWRKARADAANRHRARRLRLLELQGDWGIRGPAGGGRTANHVFFLGGNPCPS